MILSGLVQLHALLILPLPEMQTHQSTVSLTAYK
jgi:hypothetical protein